MSNSEKLNVMGGGVEVKSIASNADALKALNWLKNKTQALDDKIGEWVNKGSYNKNGAWTISGCIVGKPLLIIAQNTGYNYNGCSIVSLSGCKYPDGSAWASTSLNAMWLLGAQYGGNVCIFIPTSSSVVLRVGNWNSSGSFKLYAFN